jgi:leader peptidase (prepilin peptidase)/N-methyltransferase
LTILLIIIFSLCVGSFLNVVIYRLPIMLEAEWRGEKNPLSLSSPRSHCPHCQKSLHWFHNVPLFSFIFLKGHCAYCSHKITWTYPLVEIATVITTLFLYWHFGLTIDFMASAIFSWIIIALIIIDLKHQLLPDLLTYLLLWTGLLLNTQRIFVLPSEAIIGATAGYLFLWSIGSGYYWLTKREGMGRGDYKLLAAIGAWVGWQGLLPTILLASISGTVIGLLLILSKRVGVRTPLAFGPYLAMAGWLVLVAGERLVQWGI